MSTLAKHGGGSLPVGSAHGSAPWLIFHGRHRQNQSFFDLSKECCYTRSVPKMRGKRCYGCFYGWLLMLDRSSQGCYLWNLTSMARIALPPLQYHPSLKHCALSSPPADPNCIILFSGEEYLLCCRVNGDDKCWRRKELAPELGIDGIYCNIISCGGKFYTLADHKQLLEVNVGASGSVDVALAEVKPFDILARMRSFFYHMVESCGDVFVVVVYGGGDTLVMDTRVQVLRLNAFDKVWESATAEMLGDRALLLSFEHGSATWCFANEAGVERGCVYFVFSYSDRDLLYIYRLDGHNLSQLDLRSLRILKSKYPCQWAVASS